MRARLVALTFTLVLAIATTGCAPERPSYDDVRDEAIAVLDEVVALMPDGAIPRPRPELEPYGCGDDLLSGSGSDSAFFTGYWEVEIAEEMDVPEFISSLRAKLEGQWEVEDFGIPVPFAQVHLVRTSPHVSLTVEERERNGKNGIDLLVMSRCGLLSGSGHVP